MPRPVKTKASRHSSQAGASVLSLRDGTLALVRFIPGFILTITGKVLHEEGQTCTLLNWRAVDKNDRSDTDHVVSAQPCSHDAPIPGGSGGRCGLSHQSVIRIATVLISVHKEKNSPVWKEKGACGIPLKYKRRTLPIEKGGDSCQIQNLDRGRSQFTLCSSFIRRSTKTQE